jgi:hypothetical protein
VWLTGDAALVGLLDAEPVAQATHQLAVPPPGSAGAGETSASS